MTIFRDRDVNCRSADAMPVRPIKTITVDDLKVAGQLRVRLSDNGLRRNIKTDTRSVPLTLIPLNAHEVPATLYLLNERFVQFAQMEFLLAPFFVQLPHPAISGTVQYLAIESFHPRA